MPFVLPMLVMHLSAAHEEIKDEVINRGKGEGPCGTWGTDTREYDDSKVSYALGKQGSLWGSASLRQKEALEA